MKVAIILNYSSEPVAKFFDLIIPPNS